MKNKNPESSFSEKIKQKTKSMYIGKIIRLHSLQKISKLKIEIAEEGRSPSNFELQAIFPVKRRIISSISQIFFDRSLTRIWILQVRPRNTKPPWKIMKFCENESFSKFI